MNQHVSRELRSIFRLIAPFPLTDPRSRMAWQDFKRRYLKQPWNQRASYMSRLHGEANKLLHEAKEVLVVAEAVS